jgi:bifunctional NMN adenylyltransferase/nudix hydrolase
MKYKFAVFIGRFEPLHLGHLAILEQGFEKADKIIVVLGSHNVARNIKSPWSSEERKEMILSALAPELQGRVEFVFLRDHLYNENLWIVELQNKVGELTEDTPDSEIALLGFKSDASSYYLNSFPKWQYISCPTEHTTHAKEIRELYFTLDSSYKKYVPSQVGTALEVFKETETFRLLKDEFDYLADYKEKWRGSPFLPVFQTLDVCCIKSGHLLLVRRGKSLGKGLLALPGGFLDPDEEFEAGAIRELKEETSIKLSKEELRNHIVDQKVFSHPQRSNRGRVITNCFLINLGAGPLDKVKSGSDAEKCCWMTFNDALSRENEFFEDHAHIVSYWINRL